MPPVNRSILHRPTDLANPVYEADYKRVNWPRSEDDIRLYMRNIFIGLCAGSLVWAIIRHTFLTEQPASIAVYVSLAVMVLVTLASDLYTFLITGAELNRQIQQGQWQELRYTSLDAAQIVKAKVDIGVVRARRATVLAALCRALPLLMITLDGLLDAVNKGSLTGIMFWPLNLILLTVFTSPLLVYFCILEPGWQLRTLVTFSTYLTLRFRSQILELLLGITSVLIFRAVQFACLYFILRDLALRSFLISRLGPFVFPLIIFGFVTYLFHRLVRPSLQKLAVQCAFPSE